MQASVSDVLLHTGVLLLRFLGSLDLFHHFIGQCSHLSGDIFLCRGESHLYVDIAGIGLECLSTCGDRILVSFFLDQLQATSDRFIYRNLPSSGCR